MNAKWRYLTCINVHAAHKHTHPSCPNRPLSYVAHYCPQNSIHPSASQKMLLKRSSKSSRARLCVFRPSSLRSPAHQRASYYCCSPASCACVLFCTRPCASSSRRSGTACCKNTSACCRRSCGVSSTVVVWPCR